MRHYIPTGMVKIIHRYILFILFTIPTLTNIKCQWGYGTSGALIHFLWVISCYIHFGKQFDSICYNHTHKHTTYSYQFKCISRRNGCFDKEKTCIRLLRMFIAVLFTKIKSWKQSKYPTTVEWTNENCQQQWQKKNNNKLLLQTKIWIHLTPIRLNQRSQKQAYILCLINMKFKVGKANLWH